MAAPDRETIAQRIDLKTKPPGALGQLESLAMQLALALGDDQRIDLSPALLVFAADHGVAAHPVSIAPQAVTAQMVHNFIAGGAAVSVFARRQDIPLTVVDCGILESPGLPAVVDSRLGAGTADFSAAPAMDAATLARGLDAGRALAIDRFDKGATVLLLGEMGIGNTSASSALLAHHLGCTAAAVVGPGTGIDPQALARKSALVQAALDRAGPGDAMHALAQLGGFEIVHLVGAMLALHERPAVVVVDGFVATVAALYATAIEPGVRNQLVFAHRSAEPAAARALAELGAEPLLDLQLRLGEGSGAVLAWPLLQATADFYNDMASFESAGVVL